MIKKFSIALLVSMLLLFATASESGVRVLNSREVAIDQETFIEMSKDIERLEKIEELNLEQKNLINTLNYKISLLEQEKLLFNDRLNIKDEIISLDTDISWSKHIIRYLDPSFVLYSKKGIHKKLYKYLPTLINNCLDKIYNGIEDYIITSFDISYICNALINFPEIVNKVNINIIEDILIGIIKKKKI
jgi:hypothetical protein